MWSPHSPAGIYRKLLVTVPPNSHGIFHFCDVVLSTARPPIGESNQFNKAEFCSANEVSSIDILPLGYYCPPNTIFQELSATAGKVQAAT